MASQDYTIELLLKANNQLSKELEKIEWQINKLDKQVNQTSDSVNSAFSKIWEVIKKWAIVGAITKIWKSIRDLTTAFEPIESAFYRLSDTAWIVGEDMLQAMRKASLWTVSDFNLMSAANTAYSFWIISNIEDMTTLMEIARVKWQAMWRSMEDALDDIVRWLGRASPLILDNLWIVVKQSEAQEEYAKQVWKTVEQLTEAEKKQALVNAVVEQWKKELAETGEVWLTTQERFSQFTAQLQNLAVQIWQTFVPYVNFFFDSINEDINNNSNNIVSSIKRVVDKLWTWFAAVYTIISSLWSLLWWFFSGIRMEITNAFNKVVNGIRDWINKAIGWVNDKLGTSIWTIWEKFVLSSDEKKEWRIYSLWSAVEDVEAKWKKLADTIDESNKPITKTVNSATKSLNNLWNAISTAWWWWSWWSWKANTERLKKIQETYKNITKDVDDQYDNIIKLNKEREKWFKELQNNLDDVDKTIESLRDDVNDLKKSLSDLWKDETSDIATEFVNARKELQKMERDYAWIGEVASKYSLDYLENYQHWWIGKYDIDALIQYKKYSDEMASVYDWLNASERQAMDEQIRYQEWYQSLNGIEKIREDYRIRREEIQWELNEKLSALHTEELKRAEIEKQMAEYRKEWLNTLNEEIKKRVAMYTEKMDYEKQYMQQLEIDQAKQVEMYNELIRKARELARARSEAWWPGWTRANGWPVYEWQQYLVWEHWPELFIPSQNWSIVKNEDLWKWQEFTINVNMWWVVVNDWQDTEQLAETIANTITRQLELYKKGIY